MIERAFPRVSTQTPGEFALVGDTQTSQDGELFPATILSLSRSGVAIRLPVLCKPRLRTETSGVLRFSIDEQWLEIPVRVVWSQVSAEHRVVGARLLLARIDEGQRLVFTTWLDGLLETARTSALETGGQLAAAAGVTLRKLQHALDVQLVAGGTMEPAIELIDRPN